MQPSRFPIREPFSGLSHLLGAVLSVAGMIALLLLAQGRPLYLLGFAVYGLSLILLYGSSALYHSLHVNEEQVKRLQRLDYAAIFLLIAGTYTPVCLIVLHGIMRWGLLGAVYAIAFAGIGTILCWRKHPHWIRVALYIVMGWLAVVVLPTLRTALSPVGMAWLLAGGAIYTVGVVFYALGRPNLWPGKFSSHDLWHVFVMGGSVCHFLLMLTILPPR